MNPRIKWAVTMILLLVAASTLAQVPAFPKPDKSKNIAFGQKQPAPVATGEDQKKLGQTLFPGADKFGLTDTLLASNKRVASYLFKDPNSIVMQQLANRNAAIVNAKKSSEGLASNFHITNDINALAESDPGNIYTNISPIDWFYPVVNNVAYFEADDGVHGRELLRSNGTAAGTFLVKDINPGEASTLIRNMIAINSKVYFSASTDGFTYHPWVTDGTESGTYSLDTLNFSYSPQQFIQVGNDIYFIADGYSYRTGIWKTDGSHSGPSLVTDIASLRYAYDIEQATAANGLLFFVVYTFDGYASYGRQLWRSDGTEAGTFGLSSASFFYYDYLGPLQLTEYDHKLFYSDNDVTGRILWTSDGTTAGTVPATGNHGILLPTEYLSSNFSQPFPVFNNVLYLSGSTYAEGNGLFKYDASNSDGLVLVKDVTPTTDNNIILPGEMRITGNTLYIKVISQTGGIHDELWSSKGSAENTQQVKSFAGEPGAYMVCLKSGYGTLYFFKYDTTYGAELWKSDGTTQGTVIVKDVNPGPKGSQPWYMTECNGKVIYNCHETKTGAELWSTDGSATGTVMVKDINTRATKSSYAAIYYNGAALNDGMVFHAYEQEHGDELYASNGTEPRTLLINDITPGPYTSFPKDFSSKGGLAYFIGFPTADGNTATIYQTNGLPNGLKKIFSYYTPYSYADGYFSVADNGLVFAVVFNWDTYNYELWRSNGTAAGTFMVASNLSYNHSMTTSGNNAFFTAGDWTNGFELWVSDGTIAGTKMVKDIFPGPEGSYPYSLMAYNGSVYFSALDNNITYNYSLWKSDGTEAGTFKLANVILPYTYNNYGINQFATISNNTLLFNGFSSDYSQDGLWKTDGTVSGTNLVSNSVYYPYNLTDVKGTLYFTGYDINQRWGLLKSDGSAANTGFIKSLNSPNYLVCAGNKLYFTNNDQIWSSDDTDAGTQPVNDAFLARLNNVSNLTGVNNKLFFSAYTYQYGFELFVGNAASSSFNALTVNSQGPPKELTNPQQDFQIYPNPANEILHIDFFQKNSGSATLTVTDITGKVLMIKNTRIRSGNNFISLPIERLPAGTYLIKLSNNKNIVKKFIKL